MAGYEKKSKELKNLFGDTLGKNSFASDLNPISTYCDRVEIDCETNPEQALELAEELANACPTLLTKLTQSTSDEELIIERRDEIATTLLNCTLTHGIYAFSSGEEKDIDSMISIMKQAHKIAVSDEVKESIEEQLEKITPQNSSVIPKSAIFIFAIAVLAIVVLVALFASSQWIWSAVIAVLVIALIVLIGAGGGV